MSLYAEFVARANGEYPSGPPGEATWPTFLQVPAPSCHVWHSHASFRLSIDFPHFRRGTVPRCRRRQMPPASPPSTASAYLTFRTTHCFRFAVVEIHIVDCCALFLCRLRSALQCRLFLHLLLVSLVPFGATRRQFLGSVRDEKMGDE